MGDGGLAFCKRAEVLKVDEDLGLVFGWGIICTEKGAPYYDTGELVHEPSGRRVKSSSDGGYVYRDTMKALSGDEAGDVVRRRDHIPEDAMLKAACDFAENGRVAKQMHDGEPRGQIVFQMPLTAEVKKAFGIRCGKTGLMVAAKLDEPMLDLFRKGKLKGFSIGGSRIEDAVAEVAA